MPTTAVDTIAAVMTATASRVVAKNLFALRLVSPPLNTAPTS
jgi:hypothetical protein